MLIHGVEALRGTSADLGWARPLKSPNSICAGFWLSPSGRHLVIAGRVGMIESCDGLLGCR